MSWIDDVDRPTPEYHDSPYYHSGGVSTRYAPGDSYAFFGGSPRLLTDRPDELDDWQKALDRQLKLIKDLGL